MVVVTNFVECSIKILFSINNWYSGEWLFHQNVCIPIYMLASYILYYQVFKFYGEKSEYNY